MNWLILGLFSFFGWKLLTPQQVEDDITSGVGMADTSVANGMVSGLGGGGSFTPIPDQEPSILTTPVEKYNDGIINSN